MRLSKNDCRPFRHLTYDILLFRFVILNVDQHDIRHWKVVWCASGTFDIRHSTFSSLRFSMSWLFCQHDIRHTTSDFFSFFTFVISKVVPADIRHWLFAFIISNVELEWPTFNIQKSNVVQARHSTFDFLKFNIRHSICECCASTTFDIQHSTFSTVSPLYFWMLR